MVTLFMHTYLETLAYLCPIDQLGSTYAIAASTAGAGLLRRMGLSPIAQASERLDAHPLYCGDVASYRAAMDIASSSASDAAPEITLLRPRSQ